jgi:hypothetical protein
VRNVAFSILLVAIAVLQIAVVSAELTHSGVQTAAVANGKHAAQVALAATDSGRKTSTL